MFPSGDFLPNGKAFSHPPPSANSSITIMAVGDIMLGDHPLYLGMGVRSLIERSNIRIFEYVERALSEGDIVVGNLETVLSDHGRVNSWRSLQLRGRQDFIKELEAGHFHVINVANNHIQQHGESAALDTINLLRDNGIRVIGIDGLQPQFMLCNGIRSAFLGYSLRPEEYSNNIIYSVGDKKKILSDIAMTREMANWLIISLHWGHEYIETPSPYQIALAHELIDGGADIILGHHPHVAQTIELYRGGVIAYSMGNFVSDMCQRKSRESMILKIIAEKDHIPYVERIPVFINKTYQPQVLVGESPEEITQKPESASKSLREEEYTKLLRLRLKASRREYYKFLLVHFYRMPPLFLLWNIVQAIKRRVGR